jgi:hypothetical protein
VNVTLHDTGDLKAAAKALKQAANGKELGKQLRRELREVAKPMVPKVRAAWLAAPSQGHGTSTRARRGQPSLRRLLAKATRVEVRTAGKHAGVRVRTDGRRMPSGMKALPGYAEGIRRRPWRHPVFGDRETWVDQQPFPRFYEAIGGPGDEAQARRACEEAVETVLSQIVRPR